METDWPTRVKGMLKAELKKKNVSYRDLAERLTEPARRIWTGC